MATSCVLCEQTSEEDTQEVSFHVFPENEDRRRKWLDAIGKSEVPDRSSLCARHFSQSCFAGTMLKDDAVPSLEPTAPSDSTSKGHREEDRSTPQGSGTQLRSLNRPCIPVARPTIRRRRVHMLSDEEMKEMQPMKYVRHLKSVNWDEISKMPTEAKIAWEVAMEELKEGNDKIKQLQTHVRQLKATVRKLKAALQTRTKKATVVAARRH